MSINLCHYSYKTSSGRAVIQNVLWRSDGRAQGQPKWFTGRQYKDLAPSWSLVHETDPRKYEKRYKAEVLDKLNILRVAADLEGCVLLCWERPDEFCHRQLVAKWLKENLLMEVPELEFEVVKKEKKAKESLEMFME